MKTSNKAVKVQNSAKPSATPAKFAWDEKNEPIIVAAYKAQLKIDHTKANTNAFLSTIAVTVGAKSGQAVRSKLSSLKEYQALEKSATNILKPRVTKPVMADDIRDLLQAAGVDISDEEANSLANSNAGALKAVIAGLTLKDVPTPTPKGVSLEKK